MHPLVTIAIPTYNRADRFLGNALRCALAQTYDRLEILVSDNCSTDNTAQLMRGFTDPRIRYVRQTSNLGANGNFNYCIDNAAGEYIHLLLDDDEIDPDFVSSCMAVAAGRDVGLIRSGTRLIDGDGKLLMERPNSGAGLSPPAFFRAWFQNQLTLYVCSTLFRTASLRAAGGFHSRHNLFQDAMAIARVLVRDGHADVRECKASFRMHEANMGSAMRISAWCDDSLQLLDVICQLLPEQAAALRAEGKVFLARMNYNRVANVADLLGRLASYLRVARSFDFAVSPLPSIWRRELRPGLRKVLRKMLLRTS